jgi:hypothetical protein
MEGLLRLLYGLRRVLAVSVGGGDRGTWSVRRGGELQGVQDEDEGEDVSSFLSWRKGIGLVWA